MEDYSELKKEITANGGEFHTYTPENEKQPRLVLKGLPPDVLTEDIKEDLVKENVQVVQVTQMTKKSGDDVMKLPLFVVTFQNLEQLKIIEELKAVCNCIVRWERLMPRSNITQCFNCQSYHHLAKNCFRKPKCLKCAQEHNSRDCKKLEEMPNSCANCGKDHLANSENCETRIKQLAIQSRRQQRRRVEAGSNHAFRARGQDFPHLPPTRPMENFTANTESGATGNGIFGIFKEVKDIFKGINFTKIVNIFKTTVNNIRLAQDPIEKISCVIEAIVKYFD